MNAHRLGRWLATAAALFLGVATLQARGGGGCLAAGTRIATPRGEVAIESLRVGDTVCTVVDGKAANAVVQTITRVQPSAFVSIATSDGEALLATAEHPIAIAPGVFTRAGALVAGARLVGRAAAATVTQAADLTADIAAYDLLVSPGGVFFANGILVHNKGCFLPDTPVLLAGGGRRAISRIKVGEVVLAFDAEGKSVPARVRSVLRHEVDRYLVVRTGSVELHVTEEHPFYVGAGTFKTVGALRVGDTLWAHDGRGELQPQTLLAVERITAHTTVYNLQTEEPHTYFADGIAVHNKGGGCFAAGTLVATPAGSRAIETLAIGDTVLALGSDGALVPATVEGAYLNFSPLLVLETDAGVLRTTSEHPLLDANTGEFRVAGSFGSGELLATADGAAVLRSIVRGEEPVAVFTLSVGGPHTFLANGFVVHNKGGGGFHGGGGHHSRGSHGGGYSSSGGGGPAPVILFLVFAGVILILILKAKRGAGSDEELDYCFGRPAIEGKAGKTRQLLNFISPVDDQWTESRLQAAARDVFTKLQASWAARDYTEMKALLMADLYEQHLAQLRGLAQTHELNVLEGLSVDAVDIVHVHYAEKPAERSFTALITATARDTYLDDRTRAFIRGDTAPAQFQEFWTFQLVDGVFRLREIEQSKESDALTTENFFAPFTDTGREQIYGQAAGTTGVAGPALPAEVQDKDRKIERLLNFLVQTDRIWNRDTMLASARRTFLNVLLAWQDGRADAFAGIPLVRELAEHLRGVNESNLRAGCRVEYRNLCVRKAEIVHVDNRNDRTLDRFTARIAAHAQVIITQAGREQRHDSDVRAWVEFWTFAREGQLWVLAGIEPAAEGQSIISRENVDEGTMPQMLEWYYSKPRAT